MLLLLLLPLSVFAGCGRKSDTDALIPEPSDSFYVLDEADVLHSDTESYIVSQNDALFDLCGAQLVVACVKTTGTLDIKDYAQAMFNKWNIGSSEKNNGILLLLSIGEDDYWIMQGKGLEELLPSGTLKLMLNSYLEPDFARGNYDAGVRLIFDELIAQFERIYSISLPEWDGTSGSSTQTPQTGEESPARRDSSSAGILIWAIVIVIVILLIAVFSGFGGGGGYGRRRRRRRYATIYPRPYNMPPRPRPSSPPPGQRPSAPRPGGYPGGFSGGSRGGAGGFTRGGGAGRR